MKDGISIIVPVYNTKSELLEECIESIIKQTYKNIEIILVNDGSTQIETLDSMHDCVKKDKRVRCVNKENGGLSSARNKGIQESKMEWIMHVDSDDYLTIDACEQLINAISDDTDIVIAKNYNINFNGDVYEIKNKCDTDLVIDSDIEKKLLITSMFYEKGTKYHYAETSWAKLFRRSFIIENDITFKEDLKRAAEDGVFNFEAYMKARSIKYINKPIYYYRSNEDSICHTCNYYILNTMKRAFYYYDIMLQDINIDFKNEYNYFVFRQIKTIISRYFCNKSNKKEKNILKEEMKDFISWDECKKAIDNLEYDKLDRNNKILYKVIKTRNVNFIRAFFTMINNIKK